MIEHTSAYDDAARGDQYRHLIEHIQDAVAEFELVDGEPIVIDVNEAFIDVFGYSREELVGDSLNDWIVPEWLTDEAQDLDEHTSSSVEVNYQQIQRETADGLREFLYRGIPYTDTETRTDGFAIYTDLTETIRTERRLQVMNRILRHNLRNRANVAVGHTSRLLNERMESPEETKTAAAIEEAAYDLGRMAEEAVAIHKIVKTDTVGTVEIDCVPVVRKVVDEHQQQHSADIEMDLPAEMAVKANTKLRYAVDSLVDNAISHNPTDDPNVRVRVVDADATGWAAIYVEDDAPAIPQDQRMVVTGEAEITPTRHGTGLGLWLVKWTTELFGGDLSFATSDLGGNSVRIRLPKADGE